MIQQCCSVMIASLLQHYSTNRMRQLVLWAVQLEQQMGNKRTLKSSWRDILNCKIFLGPETLLLNCWFFCSLKWNKTTIIFLCPTRNVPRQCRIILYVPKSRVCARAHFYESIIGFMSKYEFNWFAHCIITTAWLRWPGISVIWLKLPEYFSSTFPCGCHY